MKRKKCIFAYSKTISNKDEMALEDNRYLEIVEGIGNSVSLSPSDHIYLYGSRARGEAQSDSDWDVLVVLDKPHIEQSDYDNISYPITACGWEKGEMIVPVLYTRREWEDYSFSPFYKNVTAESIQIA